MESKTLTRTLFILYLVALVWIILFKMGFSLNIPGPARSINLIPFAGSAVVNNRIDFTEIINNVIIFIPFGIFAGTLKPDLPCRRQVLPILLTSLTLEALQYLLAIGATDITDLLTNTLGGITGIGIYHILHAIFKTHTHKIINLLTLIVAALLTLLIALLILSNP